MSESTVVTAVGTSASSAKGGRPIGERIERAMAEAIAECAAVGITPTDENAPVIRQRMQAARQLVVDEFERTGR